MTMKITIDIHGNTGETIDVDLEIDEAAEIGITFVPDLHVNSASPEVAALLERYPEGAEYLSDDRADALALADEVRRLAEAIRNPGPTTRPLAAEEARELAAALQHQAGQADRRFAR